MSLRPILILLFLLSPALPLSAQGRPDLVQGSRVFDGSLRAPGRGYFSAPDTLTLEIRAGKARAGLTAGVLLGLKRASSPLPIGPDKLELALPGILAAWFTRLDAQGIGRIRLSVPAGIAPWAAVCFQGLVFPKGEPWPVRLTPALEAVLLPGKKAFYVDGDSRAGKEKGTPFAPFRKIASGLSAAAAAGGGAVYVDGLASGTYKEVLYVRSSGVLLEGRDWTGAGQGRPTVEGLMDNSPDKKRGTLNIRGSSSSYLSKITVTGIRILPSGYKPTYRGARCVRADYVKDLVFRECRFEGVAAPGIRTLIGINLGWGVSALVERCSVERLSCSGKILRPTDSPAVIGIKTVQGSGEIVVRNTWIRNLGVLPMKGEGSRAVAGIWDAGSKKLVVANCVIGPFVLPAPASGKGPYTDLFGIWTQSPGVIRNNVFHRFDLSAYKSDVKQVEGVRFYKGAGVEFTNNIFADFRLGPVVGVHTCLAAQVISGTQRVSYSCVWKVPTAFYGKGFLLGAGILLNKDPLLVPPAYTLKPGSPCLGTGNPLFPPRNMGVWGGPWAGPAGCPW